MKFASFLKKNKHSDPPDNWLRAGFCTGRSLYKKGLVKAMFNQTTKTRTAILLAITLAGVSAIAITTGALWAHQETARKSGPEKISKERIVIWRHGSEGANSFADGSLAAIDPADKKATRLMKYPASLLYSMGIDGEGKLQVRDGTMFPSFAISLDGAHAAHMEVIDDKEMLHVRTLSEAGRPGVNLKMSGHCTVWSPSGRELVVVNREGDSLEHSLVDVNTKKKKELQLPKVDVPERTNGLVGHLVTDWSRDGHWFLTTCYMGDEKKPQLYRIKSDGSEAHLLKSVKSGTWGRFSPDGKRVLYVGPDEKGRIALMVTEVAGDKPKRLSPEENGSIDPASSCWSPDGKKVAYVWTNAERPKYGSEFETFLMVTPANGGDPTAVMSEKTNRVLPIRFPQWR